jgi:hypothetical protein
LILNSKFTFKVNLEIILEITLVNSEALNKLAKRFNRYLRIIFKNNSISPKLDVIVIASRIAVASPSIIDILYSNCPSSLCHDEFTATVMDTTAC